MEIPHTAVICTPTIEDAENLRDFFVANDFYDKANGEEPFTETSDMDWYSNGEETCYDIEDRGVYSASRSYYETRFKIEYPELIPADSRWFLCTVQDFISMCNDESFNAEFDIAADDDFEAMFGGEVF